jgi:hypothetical protein
MLRRKFFWYGFRQSREKNEDKKEYPLSPITKPLLASSRLKQTRTTTVSEGWISEKLVMKLETGKNRRNHQPFCFFSKIHLLLALARFIIHTIHKKYFHPTTQVFPLPSGFLFYSLDTEKPLSHKFLKILILFLMVFFNFFKYRVFSKNFSAK